MLPPPTVTSRPRYYRLISIDRNLLDHEQCLRARGGGDVNLHALLVVALERLVGDKGGPGSGGRLIGLFRVLGRDDTRFIASGRWGGPTLRRDQVS